MKITALIPTYNRSRLLERALRSILAQNYEEVCIHIGDNSDDHAAAAVIEKFRPQLDIKHFKHPQNIGALANFKFLTETVETDYYHILSDDDMIGPDFYAEWEALYREARTPLYCFRTLIVDCVTGSYYIHSRPWKAGVYQPTGSVLNQLASAHFCGASVIYSSQEIAQNPLLDDPFGSDHASIIRLGAKHSFSVSEKIGGIFFFYDHNRSWSSRNSASSAANSLQMQLARLADADSDPLLKTEELLIAKLYAEIFAAVARDECSGPQSPADTYAPARQQTSLRNRIKAIARRLKLHRRGNMLSKKELSDLDDPEKAVDLIKAKCNMMNA